MHLKKTNDGKNASIFTYSFLTTVDFNCDDNMQLSFIFFHFV